MILHAPKTIRRPDRTIQTTLCGRANAKSRDGMNIALTDSGVSCKFCLRILARAAIAKGEK